MDPNMNPQPTPPPPPPGAPQPAAAPIAPGHPQTPPPAAPFVPPAPAGAPQPPVAPSGDTNTHKRMILIIVIAGIGAVVAALVLVWFVFLAPSDDKSSQTSNDSKNSSKADASKDTSDNNSSKQTNTSTATSCLGPNDFEAFWGTAYKPDADGDGRYNHGDAFFFKPDNTEYAYPSVTASAYEKYKKFYAQKSTKDFTITLSGEVNSAARDDALANQRAEKVKAELIAQGIPASRIVIKEPTYEAATGSSDGTSNRAVTIRIQSSDSCKK